MKTTHILLFLLTTLAILMPYPAHADAAYCTPNATKQCISNIVYWYNSCGALESIAQNCNLSGQICQNAQCIYAQKPITNPNPPPYQNPPQYQPQNPGQYQSQPIAQAPAIPANTVSLVFLATKEGDASQWSHAFSAAANDKLVFLAIVKNTSLATLNNVIFRADLPGSIAYTGNLKVNGLDTAGNLSSGISLGALTSKESKVITFSATAQAQGAQTTATINAMATADTAPSPDNDSITITIPATQAQNTGNGAITTGSIVNNAVTPATTSTFSFLDFIKKWWLWMIITIILAVLFVIIFRRLSSSV